MKSEKYTISLYLDNNNDNRILEYIKLNFNYAYIVHDRDINEDGEIKKEHCHVMFIFENARELNSVAKELNIEAYRIENIKSIKYMARYLIHLDQPEKAQYKYDEITTNIKDFKKHFNTSTNEREEMLKILEFIYSVDRYIYYHEVLEFVLYNNYYATYRRAGNQIVKIIDEHNRLFLERRRDNNGN